MVFLHNAIRFLLVMMLSGQFLAGSGSQTTTRKPAHLPTVPVKPATTLTARQQITAAYATYAEAIQRKDVDRIASILSADFTFKSRGQTLGRNRYIEQVKLGTQYDIQYKTVQIKIDAFGATPQEAQVTTSQVHDATVKMTGEDKRRRVVQHFLTKDTWIKTSRGWMLRGVNCMFTYIHRESNDDVEPIKKSTAKSGGL